MSLIIILTAGHTDLVLLPVGDLGPGAAPSHAMVSSSVSEVVAVDELKVLVKKFLWLLSHNEIGIWSMRGMRVHVTEETKG